MNRSRWPYMCICNYRLWWWGAILPQPSAFAGSGPTILERVEWLANRKSVIHTHTNISHTHTQTSVIHTHTNQSYTHTYGLTLPDSSHIWSARTYYIILSLYSYKSHTHTKISLLQHRLSRHAYIPATATAKIIYIRFFLKHVDKAN